MVAAVVSDDTCGLSSSFLYSVKRWTELQFSATYKLIRSMLADRLTHPLDCFFFVSASVL